MSSAPGFNTGRLLFRDAGELAGTFDGFKSEAGIVSCLEPVDVPHTGVVHLVESAAAEQGLAFVRDAALDGIQVTRAATAQTAVFGTEFLTICGNAPRRIATVACASATTWDQQIELTITVDVVSDVGRHDDHGLVLERLGTWIVAAIVAAACELQVVASAAGNAASRVSGDETEGNLTAVGPRSVGVAGGGIAAIASARRIL